MRPAHSHASLLEELAYRSLKHFSQQAWSIVEPGTKLIWGKHLDAICEHLEAVSDGRIRSLLINVPPGHMKSLLVSVFWPAWQWLRRPMWRAIFASYADGLALRDSVKCRTILTSDWYRGQPDVDGWNLSGDQNVKSFFLNTRQGFRISTTVGGQGTGFRGDAIVVDDPMKADDAFSKPAREAVIRWWRYTIGNRLSDMRKGARVVIMQRLHEEDLSGHLLTEEQGQWEHVCLPTEYEPELSKVTSIGWQDWRTKKGELLFPAMFPKEVIDGEKKRLGSIGYPGQHQQRPTAAEGGMFKRSWWRFWRHAWEDDIPALKERTVVLPEKFDDMALSWDCAFKGTSESDYVAGGVWGKAAANKYLLDLTWDQMDFPETVKALRAQATKWPKARAKLVEDAANGPAVISTLRNEIAGIIAVNPQGGKEARAAATSPQVEAGNVYLPLHAEWRERYIEEHHNFPLGAHDDAVDQQSQMLLRWGGSNSDLDYLRLMGSR